MKRGIYDQIGWVIMLASRGQCVPEDLARHRSGKPLEGDIKVGEVYEWEPDKPWAADTVVVVRIDGERDRILTRARGERGASDEPCWNDISRFREACVRSQLRDIV